ncbi:hypothetical protein P368_22090 [Comamonas thiooxydans]|nr:hypothetical protein P369_20670 [Comamonas thiooxydans]KGG95222.1 hypothetical protein P367_21305 [Comamonas thiooxydans]KGG96828.1 hypothetical protein P365_24195 [Comamonas thiooxydans]KGH06205.1 hypothetical protein P368_22090 [Comamonas thiooxydans]
MFYFLGDSENFIHQIGVEGLQLLKDFLYSV